MEERVVMVVEPGDDLRPVLRAAQLIAPEANDLHVVALLRAGDDSHRDLCGRAIDALEAELTHWPLATGAIHSVTTSFELRVDPHEVEGALVVAGPWNSRSARKRARALLELSNRARLVLSVGAGAPRTPSAHAQTVALAFLDGTALPALTTTVRSLPGVRVVVGLALGGEESRREELEASLRALLPGVAVELELLPGDLVKAARNVGVAAARHGAELLVIPRAGPVAVATTGLFAAHAFQAAEIPCLIVHVEPPRAERLVASDSLAVAGAVSRVTLELVGSFGRIPLSKAQVELAGHDRVLAVEDGAIELPADVAGPGARLSPFGVSLLEPPLSGVAAAHIIGSVRPLILVDAALAPEHFGDLERMVPDAEVVFVRLRTDVGLAEVRERILARLPWGGPVLVLDASVWLEDGGASDVPRAVDVLRLVRLGVRLRVLGAHVAGVVTSSAHAPFARDIHVFTPAALARFVPGTLAESPSRADVVEALTGAKPVRGNAVRLEFDNATARHALLEAAATARERLHLQAYLFEDDSVVRTVGSALAAAAARGIKVRVLADALYSLHGAYGAANHVLEWLASSGVEVRAWQPLSGLPSLESLKARNHRKVLIVDGERAWITGRNLGAVYYRGFDEVELTRSSPFAEVPWVDCGARVEGPIVADVERAFLTDWQRAGGDAFEVKVPGPAGALECRLVQHDGVTDTNTLELQRMLIERAKNRLLLVSTFPLVLELQRALIAAVRRGVRVQLLFGNVRPRWGDRVPFGGGVYRGLGDELVRTRLEPVLRAGAEGFEVSLAPRPGWSADLGAVLPHVHAKLLIRDEAEVAVGSANVDVTSAYWESESLLLVNDADFARQTLTQLAPFLDTARRVDLRSSGWAPQHARRQWLGRNWPRLIG